MQSRGSVDFKNYAVPDATHLSANARLKQDTVLPWITRQVGRALLRTTSAQKTSLENGSKNYQFPWDCKEGKDFFVCRDCGARAISYSRLVSVYGHVVVRRSPLVFSPPLQMPADETNLQIQRPQRKQKTNGRNCTRGDRCSEQIKN